MTNTAHKNRMTADGKMSFAPREIAPPPADLAGQINELIDAALVTKRKAEYDATRGSGVGDVAFKRIGAGYIGLECSRQLAMKYHKVEANEDGSYVTPGALNRHAEAGHWTEAATATWLRDAGFEVMTHRCDEDGKTVMDRFGKPMQLGFFAANDPETGQARIAGNVDGVIVGVPPGLAIPLPCIWESKKATAKKYKKFSTAGVQRSDTKYYGQVQTNMAYMEIKHTLFSMLNLDSMEFYWELIPFDPSYAQDITDRAVRVIQSKVPEELPRITNDPSFYLCKQCPYQKPCWNEPIAPAAPAPHWITGESK